MALQGSGQIKLGDVNVELGYSATTYITLGSSEVRNLFGIGSGQIKLSDGYGATSQTHWGDRYVLQGAMSGTSHMHYCSISSLTGAGTFVTLSNPANNGRMASSNGSRGVWGGGGQSFYNSVGVTAAIEYITFSSTGSISAFGNLSLARRHGAGASDGIKALFIMGQTTGGESDQARMDYVTISSTGNSTNFGNMGGPRDRVGADGSLDRALAAGGEGSGYQSRIDYVTYASLGNSVSFGNLGGDADNPSASSNDSRIVWWAGGRTFTTTSKYNTIATTGNSVSFGSLAFSAAGGQTGTSDGSRGITTGGHPNYSKTQYLTIATTGNSSDAGSLFGQNFYGGGACSGD